MWASYATSYCFLALLAADLHSRELASASLARFNSDNLHNKQHIIHHITFTSTFLQPFPIPILYFHSHSISLRLTSPPNRIESALKKAAILTQTPIQCDETHPTCNNCKKSKRECLGYDPIFKQQQSPGSSNGGSGTIQSAASNNNNGNISPPASITDSIPPSTSTVSAPYTTHPTPILTPSESTGDPLDNHHHHNSNGGVVKVESGSDTEIKTHGTIAIDPALPASFATAHGASNGINGTEYSQQPDALHLRGGVFPEFS